MNGYCRPNYNENDEAQTNDYKLRLKDIYEQTEQLPE